MGDNVLAPEPKPPSTARRNTRQRKAVMNELRAKLEFRSAQRIHEDLAAAGQRIGLATVYRNLRALAEEGEVDVLLAADGEALYRRCDVDTHHHHLVCRQCLRTEEIEARAVEKWVHSLGKNYGYTNLEHSIEVYGTCAQCSAAGSASAPATAIVGTGGTHPGSHHHG